MHESADRCSAKVGLQNKEAAAKTIAVKGRTAMLNRDLVRCIREAGNLSATTPPDLVIAEPLISLRVRVQPAVITPNHLQGMRYLVQEDEYASPIAATVDRSEFVLKVVAGC